MFSIEVNRGTPYLPSRILASELQRPARTKRDTWSIFAFVFFFLRMQLFTFATKNALSDELDCLYPASLEMWSHSFGKNPPQYHSDLVTMPWLESSSYRTPFSARWASAAKWPRGEPPCCAWKKFLTLHFARHSYYSEGEERFEGFRRRGKFLKQCRSLMLPPPLSLEVPLLTQ